MSTQLSRVFSNQRAACAVVQSVDSTPRQLLSRKKRYTVGNSGQLRSLLSRSTALVSAGGSKGAICIAVFSLNHKSLLLFRMCNFVAHFFAACFVTVCCAVLAVESVCTCYSLVCQQVVGLTATGWRQVRATGLAH